jgi:CRP-like cAMP-binding protein
MPHEREFEVPAGRVIIEFGQTGSGLFVITSGTVIVDAPEGTRELGPGESFGEIALETDGGARTARVRAKTDVKLVAIDRVEFERGG